MQNIYQVINSYHLMEGLDSEFLVIASDEEEAKDVCLQMLAEDQDSHIETIKQNIESLKKGLDKKWLSEDTNDPAMAFIKKANDRNRETILRYATLLKEFNGYKRECLTVRKINPRLKNGHIQYD